MRQHQERCTLSDRERALLKEISLKLGWRKSRVLQVAFFEFCERRGLISGILATKPLGAVVEESRSLRHA